MNILVKFLGVALITISHETSAGRRSHDTGPKSEPFSFQHMQTLMTGFDMEWTSSHDNITFKLKVKTKGWVGFGITPTNDPRGMTGADIVICGAMPDGRSYIFDTIALGNTLPRLDQSQDVQLLSATEVNGFTTVVFRRKLRGNGHDDVDITTGKVGILFAFGTGSDPSSLQEVTYHGQNRGKMSLVLLPGTPTSMPATAAIEIDNEGSGSGNEITQASDRDLNRLDFERRESFEVGLTGQMLITMIVKEGNITFELTATTLGWMGIGFAEVPGMADADIIMCGYGKNGPYLYDTYSFGDYAPVVEKSQDVELLSGKQNETHTTITFTRMLVASDQNDQSITMGRKLYFLYAFGTYDLIDGPHNINYHYLNRGSIFTDLTSKNCEDCRENILNCGLAEGGARDDVEFAGIFGGNRFLNEQKTVQLSWWNNGSDIKIRISAPTSGWVGFGISPGKDMSNADIVMAGVSRGTPYILDAFARRNGAPIRGEEQNVKLISYSQNETGTSVTFQRTYSANSRRDVLITDGPMNIIWAFGRRNVRLGNPKTGGYHGKVNRGSAEVPLVHPLLRASLYPKSGKVVLDRKSEVILQWLVDSEEAVIYFQLGALTKGWIGLGISPGSDMKKADIAMMGVKNGHVYGFDAYAPSNTVPRVEESQDVDFLISREVDGRTIVIFRRFLRAVENRVDRMINEGKVTVIWAFGENDLGEKPKRRDYHGQNRGAAQIQLIPLMEGKTIPPACADID